MEKCVIRNRAGNVISSSRNLRGIRAYVSKNIITVLDISKIGDWEGKLSILFDNDNSFETNFASYDVLKNFVRNWRNTYGAPLTVNGEANGKVSYKNPALT